MSAAIDRDLIHLRRELLERLEARPFKTWPPSLIRAVVAVIDLHAAESGTSKAPVLQLVPRGDGNQTA
jgi:hypothetical protein